MTAPASLLLSPVRALPGVAAGDAVGGGANGFDALLAQLAATLGAAPTGETAAGTGTAGEAEANNDQPQADGPAAPMIAFNGWFVMQQPGAPLAQPLAASEAATTSAPPTAVPTAVDQPLAPPQPGLTDAAKAMQTRTPPTATASSSDLPGNDTATIDQPQAPPQPHLTGAGKATDAQTLPPAPKPIAANLVGDETSVVPSLVAAEASQADTTEQIAGARAPIVAAAAAAQPPVESKGFRKTATGDSPVKVVAQSLANADPAAAASSPVTAADATDPDPLPSQADAAPLADGAAPDAAADRPMDGFAQTLAGRLEGLASGVNAAAAHLRSGPETINRLVAGIISKVDGGQATRFDLQLDPLGLGKVDVSVEIGADGRMVAALSFDNAQAASDLRSRGQELRQALEQAGFSISDSGLSFDFAGQNPQRDPTGEEAPRSGLAGRAFAQALDALQDEAVLPRRFQAQRGLDILI
jgi:flagellar hook-length control protein FliK